MDLLGKNMIGGEFSARGSRTFRATNPTTGEALETVFTEANEAEIGAATAAAEKAFQIYSRQTPEQIAKFLEKIAEEILALGEGLLEMAHAETALPMARLTGERGRTINQIKMFAELVREGSWLEASIDRAQPNRAPLPKPDLRKMLIPLGPVAVFGASNFPLAFSVAGGDTISALAAKNTVVVKGHPAHPGTSELVAGAVQRAVRAMQMPAGTLSLIQGTSNEVSLQLVCAKEIKAVGFTGSLRGGRALFDAAAARPEPIPVYAEMGSTNPVFILPGALEANGAAIAEGLVQSVTVGVGQFCTNPGLVFGLENESLKSMIKKAGELMAVVPPAPMLNPSICQRFSDAVAQTGSLMGVTLAGTTKLEAKAGQGSARLFSTTAEIFLKQPELHEEMFGPASIIVTAKSTAELENIAQHLPGQLTATIHGTPAELEKNQRLISILQSKVGRLIFNGFPTGVEVCPSMHHSGPYPASTDVHFTSVGTAAIKRFARPVCFQNFPQAALPPELQDNNPRKIWRIIDGQFTRGSVGDGAPVA